MAQRQDNKCTPQTMIYVTPCILRPIKRPLFHDARFRTITASPFDCIATSALRFVAADLGIVLLVTTLVPL